MDISKLMKQAKEMQEKMQAMQAELSTSEYIGKSGGGMVVVTMLGSGEIKKAQIDPSLIKIEDKEMLEDLIVAALNDARSKVDASAKESTSGILGGLGLPAGLKLPF